MDKYNTIYEPSTIEFIEKKSKFISYSSFITTEDEAINFINNIKKINLNASHNVFAYRLKNKIERQSDDGEPNGTAGMPILDFLRKKEIFDIVIVATRYYGGTLLGTGGLIRAYSNCAKLVLDKSQIITKTLYQIFDIICNYSISSKIKYEILQEGNIIKDTLYTDNVNFIVLVEYNKKDEFIKKISTISNNKCIVNLKDTTFAFSLDNKLHM